MGRMAWKSEHSWAAAAVLAILAALRLPALTGPPNLSQDATEYIDIARNVAAGEGLTLKIRGYFFGDGYKVPYPAESLRRPLFPVLMAPLYKATQSNAVFQWFNFGLCLVNLAMLALLLRRALPPWIAVYSLLLAGLTEPMFLTSIFPWSEQTAFFGLLLAMLLAGRIAGTPAAGIGTAMASGLACAFAALGRPEYLLCGVLFGVWLLIRRAGRFPFLLFAAAFLAPLAALSAGNYIAYGRTFLPGDYLFHSRLYASYFSWETQPRQGAVSFLSGNWLWIAGRIGLNLANYTAKLAGWKNLFVLALALPVAFRSWREYDWRKRHLLVTGAAFFGAYCLIWAGMDRERYLLAVTPFWLPLCVYEATRLRVAARARWLRCALPVALVAGLPLMTANMIHAGIAVHGRTRLAERFYAKHNAAWDNSSISALTDWIRQNTADRDVLCLENPFLVNYATRRPAVVLPEQLRADEFFRFLSEYNVSYWIENSVDTKRPADGQEALRQSVSAAGGTEIARIGTYRVWRLPRAGVEQRNTEEMK
jgi:hypothetical protein